MFTVKDTLDAILLGAFLFGLVFSVISLVVGDLRPHVHLSAHDAQGDVGGLPVNASTVLAFLAWFGGVGYLAREGLGWPGIAAIVVGLVGGLAGAAIVAVFLVKVLRPHDQSLNPEDYRLPGVIARVASTIRPGGTGEVIYEQAGVRQVSAARAENGTAIGRGEEVVVLRSSHGIAIVEPASTFFGEGMAMAGPVLAVNDGSLRGPATSGALERRLYRGQASGENNVEPGI
jgi:membrane protein implicated in regulation of membrane protease activity